jgi:NitT/TauT family transport system permease protein/sulfonate transport system permease protein
VSDTAGKPALLDRLIADGTIVALIVVWWLIARQLPTYVLPGPYDVLQSLARFVTDGATAFNAFVSLTRVVASVLIAMVMGVLIALAVQAAPILNATVERRLLVFLSSFPSVGWAILGVVWFKISTPTVLFIQTAIILPFCIVNALAGFRQLDQELDEMGLSMTRSPVRRFFKLTLPLIAPFLVAGLRIAYGICWKIALVSELFGASSGLGYLLMNAQSTSDAAMVFACCLVIVVIYTATDYLLLKPLAERFSVNQGLQT